MTNRYSLSDNVLTESTAYLNLRIENNQSSILNIYRLISGTVNVKDLYTNKVYKLRENHIKLPTFSNRNNSQKNILDNFPEEVTIEDLNQYFLKAKSNIKFYKSIEVELVKCIIAYKESKYLESFFYLYRIIEGISYSVPLIYVSKKSDYNKTYHDLQSYFGKDKDGELNFFKRFVSETFREEEFYKSNIVIDLLDIEIEEIRAKYYKLYIGKLKDNAIVDKEENVSIKIKFIGFYDFMIELRNRFFHNAKGTWQENFESTELLYPDMFFKPIMKHGINWLSIIIFEIIKVDFDKIKK